MDDDLHKDDGRMVDLKDATTQEIFDELKGREDAVILLCWRYLEANRQENYRNYHGAYAVIFGLLEQARKELRDTWVERQPEDIEGD